MTLCSTNANVGSVDGVLIVGEAEIMNVDDLRVAGDLWSRRWRPGRISYRRGRQEFAGQLA
jgi:hypothetical protein